jgi:PIN domain nuclease of toxin-antitoxin system
MTAVSHVLDMSALLAHYFDEPGADEVQRLWAAGTAKRAKRPMRTSMN